MGYILNKLANLPVDGTVKCYIFIISAGYDDPLNELIEKNFPLLATNVGNNAIIVKGTDAESFGDDVISKYLGSSTEGYLGPTPALLVTDTHPSEIHEWSLRLLIPLQNAEQRFPNGWNDFFSQLAKYARGENPDFLLRFQAVNDIDAISQAAGKLVKAVEIKPGWFGVRLDIKELLRNVPGLTPKPV